RARAQARQVRARARLGEELAPHLGAAQGGGRVAALLLLRPVGEERGHAHAEPDLEVAAWHEVPRFLLRVDHLVDRRQRPPAPLRGRVGGAATPPAPSAPGKPWAPPRPSTPSRPPPGLSHASTPPRFSSACLASHDRASARNAASSRVSSKSMGRAPYAARAS